MAAPPPDKKRPVKQRECPLSGSGNLVLNENAWNTTGWIESGASSPATSVPSSMTELSFLGAILLDRDDLSHLASVLLEPDSFPSLRKLTQQASAEIQTLLEHLNGSGASGSLIVGHDGLLIAKNLPPEYDPLTVAATALGIYFNSTNMIREMNHSHLHQLVAFTEQGLLIVADFGGAILVSLSSTKQTDETIRLMRQVTTLCRQ